MNYRGTIAYRAGLGGNVPEGFLASVVSAWDFLLSEWNREQRADRLHFMRGLSCMLHDSANQIAQGFLGDWVLFLDTDHVFKSDAFYEMVTTFEENSLDILTGFAQKRQPPYHPIIQRTDFDPLKNFETVFPNAIEKNTLIPIDAAGLSCLMVRRNVFDAMKKLGELPFDFRSKFGCPPILSGTCYGGRGFKPYTQFQIPKDRRDDEFYWEDISFFWRAKLMGFEAYCAPWIKFHHIETRLVTDDMVQMDTSPIPK